MQVNDDLFLGNAQAIGTLRPTSADNPTAQAGVGPMGRVAFHNMIPLTKQAANVAALQAVVAAGLVLAAGTGATSAPAPDGSGGTVIVFDTPRAVSLTSAANLSAINFTITGFDLYGRRTSQTRAGPNANTVNTLKAFASVLSVTASAGSGSTVSIGSADIFGLPYTLIDIGYIVSNKWAGALAQDAGTAVVADATSPATAATGDPRGTYAPSSASDGVKRLVICQHLDGTQAGAASTLVAAVGVTPA